jgi:hypothetical protein
MNAHQVMAARSPSPGFVPPRRAFKRLVAADAHSLKLQLYGIERLLGRDEAARLRAAMHAIGDEVFLGLSAILMPELHRLADVHWLRAVLEHFDEEMRFQDGRPEGVRRHTVTLEIEV